MCHELWISSTWLKKHSAGVVLVLWAWPTLLPHTQSSDTHPRSAEPGMLFPLSSLILCACILAAPVSADSVQTPDSSVSSPQWDCWPLPHRPLFVSQVGNYLRQGVMVLVELIKFISHFSRIMIHCCLISIAVKLPFHIFDLFCCCFRLEDEIQSFVTSSQPDAEVRISCLKSPKSG